MKGGDRNNMMSVMRRKFYSMSFHQLVVLFTTGILLHFHIIGVHSFAARRILYSRKLFRLPVKQSFQMSSTVRCEGNPHVETVLFIECGEQYHRWLD